MCSLSFAVAPDITARRAFSSSPKAGMSCFFAETGALDSTHTRFEATNRLRKPKTSVEQPSVIPLGYCHFDRSFTGWYSASVSWGRGVGSLGS